MISPSLRLSMAGGAALVLALASMASAQTAPSVPGFKVAQPAAPATPAVAQAPSVAKIAPPRPQDVPGRYIILREANRDTGCMVTLDDKARGTKGRKAILAPACRDQGLVIFDPSGWAFERGRLTLYARKGHGATFDPYADGTWQKDPKEGGKPLGLRKI